MEASLHMRKPRKVRRVMGWLLSRQLSSPPAGVSDILRNVIKELGRIYHFRNSSAGD
jgi:hypothetical protein